jgi:hypothetical protein
MTVLKVIGIILLCILALIVILALVFLFWPIFYKIKGSYKENEPHADLNIHYLLWLFNIHIKYDYGTDPMLIVKLFFIPVYKKSIIELIEKYMNSEETLAEGEESEEGKESESETSLDETSSEDLAKEDETEEGIQEITENEGSLEDDESFHEYTEDELEDILNEDDYIEHLSLIGKFRVYLSKIHLAISNLIKKCYNIKDSFVQFKRNVRRYYKLIKHYYKIIKMPCVKGTLKRLKEAFFKLLKLLKPSKARLNLHLGFDDPSTTAKVYSYYCMLIPFIGRYVTYNADFDNVIYEGDGYVKGKVVVFPYLWLTFRLFLYKDVRQFIRIIIREVRRNGRK